MKKFKVLLVLVLFLLPNLAFGKVQDQKQNKQPIQSVKKVEFEENIEGVKNEVEKLIIKKEKDIQVNDDNQIQLKDVSKDVDVKEDFKEEKEIPTNLQEIEGIKMELEIDEFNGELKELKEMKNQETGAMQEVKEQGIEMRGGEEKPKEPKEINEFNIRVEERKSRVANSVEEMLNVAERNQGIGEQIKNIIQTQNQIQEDADNSLKDIKSRSNFVQFLIGPDYKKIEQTQEKIQKYEKKITELKEIENQLENIDDKTVLKEQINEIEQIKEEVKEEVRLETKSFSLFGWLNKAFLKKKK